MKYMPRKYDLFDDMFDGEYGLTAHFADGSSKSLVLVKDKKHNNR